MRRELGAPVPRRRPGERRRHDEAALAKGARGRVDHPLPLHVRFHDVAVEGAVSDLAEKKVQPGHRVQPPIEPPARGETEDERCPAGAHGELTELAQIAEVRAQVLNLT